MDLRSVVLRGVEYGLWANEQWIAAIGGFKDLARAQLALEHILGAERIWLERCGMPLPAQDDDRSLASLFQDASAAWQRLVHENDLGTPIVYTNFAGETFANSLGDIALHVINHGTYHRGHLRGLAQAEGLVDFPETDYIKYVRELEPAMPADEVSYVGDSALPN